MGFSEDDRIRAKNKVNNEAFDMLEGMKQMGFSNDEIKRNLQTALTSPDIDSFRIDVFNTMLKILGRLDETTNS